MNNISPELFIKFSWSLNYKISTADSSVLCESFLKKLHSLSKLNNIEFHCWDLTTFPSDLDIFNSLKNIEDIRYNDKKTILIFKNCEPLSNLRCSNSFYLRTMLTTKLSNNFQSIFISDKENLLKIFANRISPFYQSHYMITEYSK